MCNVFSGLIVTKKGKDWGKVLFLSGVHHEKDRAKIKDKYGDDVLAWECVIPYSLKEIKFTHELNVSQKEQTELMKLIMKWCKKQNTEKLLRSMITVTQDNKPTENYKILDNMIRIGDNMSIVCDFSVNITAGDSSTQTARENSTQKAGWNSTQTARYGSTQTAGCDSTQTAGCDSTQTAGCDSTQTAGWNSTQTGGDNSTQTAGDNSTQTAGCDSTCIIYGDTSYIILDGKNVLLTQKYKQIRKNIIVDDLFKKYKKGDKIKIVKGKECGKEKRNEVNENE